jgi:FkbM family methyltransferase
MSQEPLPSLISAFAKHPLQCRPSTSDIAVFWQVFIDLEYSCVDDVRMPGLVIDCGANVGYSAAYFLTRFPECRVIAVEPDPESFAVLAANLAPYGERALALRSAVWSHPTRLALVETPYRDGQAWTRQVRECRPGEEGGIPAIDIASLLAGSVYPRISILKVDIEGAEGVVFGQGFEPWIDRVDNLVIEIHDDSSFGDCSRVFGEAIAGRGFTLSRHLDLTICRRAAG